MSLLVTKDGSNSGPINNSDAVGFVLTASTAEVATFDNSWMSATLAYPYLRHLHGKPMSRRMLRFIGLPWVSPTIREASCKRCETDYCIQSGDTDYGKVCIDL